MADRSDRGPRRRVVEAMTREAQTGLLSARRRTKRWWDLNLECGHEVERPARYTRERTVFVPGGGRSYADLLPAPEHVWCEVCAREDQA